MTEVAQEYRVCVAQMGARRHYLIPRALHRAGLLECFYTDIYVGGRPWLQRLLRLLADAGSSNARRWLGRQAADLPAERVVSLKWWGLLGLMALRVPHVRKRLDEWYAYHASGFSRRVARRGYGNASIVYGFNGASLEMFRHAGAQGLKCILDQTLLPRKIYFSIMREELRKWPGWQDDLHVPAGDTPLQEREEEEWRLADVILCGSSYLRQALISRGCPPQKVHVLRYHFDPPQDAGRHDGRVDETLPLVGRRDGAGGLNVLFVGEVGLRKGAPYLLEAFRRMKGRQHRLKLVGRVAISPDVAAIYTDCAEFVGPVPRAEMPRYYRWADVLVLPSLVEGAAMVMREAVYYGLPVICTPNAGGDVEDGVEGIVINPASSDDIIQALERVPELPLVRESGRNGANEGDALERYTKQLKEILRTVL